jgi:rhodanese-related sulfurtransferase
MKETNTSWIISTIKDSGKDISPVNLFKAKLTSWLKLRFLRPPVITEQSTLEEIGTYYSGIWNVLEKKYKLPKTKLDPKWTLSNLSKNFDLPPAQIIFMEIQLEESSAKIEQITALEAQKIIQTEKTAQVFDVREAWEREFGSLPKSKTLNKTSFKELLKKSPKDMPIILYCHFGVRSLDAAHHFTREGFTRVYTIKGGIDAWSTQVDPSIPRYSGSYC